MNVPIFQSHPRNLAMKTFRLPVLLLIAVLIMLAPRPVEARVEVSFDFFYESLAPYGEWVEIGDYGYCWRPAGVDREWAPYADGYWAFTDAGWTWVSYEDFGGIVYHYGRWVCVEEEGWCWVPDYEWGPAWVSWRNNDDYVGWAPLPPEALWQPSVGFSVWVDRVYDIGPAHYSFCHVRDFGAPVLRPVIINRAENVTIIRRTSNSTNITYNTNYGHGPVIYNGGPNYAFINQRSARRVPSLKLVQNVTANLPGSRDWDRDGRRNLNAQAVGNQLIVVAPGVKPPVNPGFLKSKVKKVIAADRVTRGWNGVKNDEVRRELQQEVQRQTRGLSPDTAPARAVVAADLQILPKTADPQALSPSATSKKGDRSERQSRAADMAAPNVSQPIPQVRETVIPPAAQQRLADQERARLPRQERTPVSTPPDAGADLRVVRPGQNNPRMRDSVRQQEQIATRQAEAAAQQRQADAQRRAADVRQNQNNEAAAAQQRMQAEQGRAARQQAEAAAAGQQKQTEALRRQQNQQQMAEQQQRRQVIEQERSQRDQMRQQVEGQRRNQPSARAVQPPPNATPSAIPAESDKERRGKKKDN
jgi:hypothetical protein